MFLVVSLDQVPHNLTVDRFKYGLNLSKQAISKADRCFIVEGYTDVISMHQNGVENVVSASGTALGPQQIQLIKRSTNNVTLLFDGDKAGIKATLRTIDLCLKAEMNVKIASFPDGEDPDSFSKKLSTEEFQEYLEKSAINFVDYLIELYWKQLDQAQPWLQTQQPLERQYPSF